MTRITWRRELAWAIGFLGLAVSCSDARRSGHGRHRGIKLKTGNLSYLKNRALGTPPTNSANGFHFLASKDCPPKRDYLATIRPFANFSISFVYRNLCKWSSKWEYSRKIEKSPC